MVYNKFEECTESKSMWKGHFLKQSYRKKIDL